MLQQEDRNKANAYLETIDKGIRAARSFGRQMSRGKGTEKEQLARLKEEIRTADAVVIGAGAGLSTSAGFCYTGERLQKYFGDFVAEYRIPDMYSGGFMVMRLKPEISWAYWARYIYINRYMDPPKPVYHELCKLLRDRDYFVITTNVDHMFQKAGFDKNRLFYTQGDYGLFQTVDGRNGKTYDNEDWVMKAMEAQGFVRDTKGLFQVPEDGRLIMEIPTALLPKCPDDGSDVSMNLRADSFFVEDAGWAAASAAYGDFLREHEKRHVLYLELGVGANTPVIIKYPFWQLCMENERAVYACINYGEAFCPKAIEDRSICIDKDIGEVLEVLKN